MSFARSISDLVCSDSQSTIYIILICTLRFPQPTTSSIVLLLHKEAYTIESARNCNKLAAIYTQIFNNAITVYIRQQVWVRYVPTYIYTLWIYAFIRLYYSLFIIKVTVRLNWLKLWCEQRRRLFAPHCISIFNLSNISNSATTERNIYTLLLVLLKSKWIFYGTFDFIIKLCVRLTYVQIDAKKGDLKLNFSHLKWI